MLGFMVRVDNEVPLHDENVDDNIDQVQNIAEDHLGGPVPVASVVI
jgi:hypothetical protein